MIDRQQTIFDLMYPKYKITKPIRLIEFFAGYGSQALALKYLSDSSLYHLAGDSIVVNVLMAIFKELIK